MNGTGGRSVLMPAGVFDFLLGTWRLQREVRKQAVMVGTLRVTATGARTAEYDERVRVTAAEGAVFAGSQRYLLRRTGEGVVLCFAETGAVFQELRFAPGEDGLLRAEAVHVCGEDRYESVYALGPERAFTARHVVRGPRKAYVSETQFSARSVRTLELGERGIARRQESFRRALKRPSEECPTCSEGKSGGQ